MAQKTTTTRAPFDGSRIPQTLRAQKRWAPWKAVPSRRPGKVDKIPYSPTSPEYGLSTAKPERWGTFEQAVAAVDANPGAFAGVGYVMTGAHGVVGVDLDNCVTPDGIADWAKQVIHDLNSYAELSPSGRGLRIFVQGEVPADWTNHDRGIEVYGGNEPRFLTVTGQRLAVTAPDVLVPPAGALAALTAQYAKERAKCDVIQFAQPEILDELALPDLRELDVPPRVRDFLTDGPTSGDRSGQMFAASVALYVAGLTDAEVFTILSTNEHAMGVALAHRRDDHDRALMYIWVEHCQKAKAKAATKSNVLDDFEILEAASPVESAQAATEKVAKPLRFQFIPGEEFFNSSLARPRWLIKKFLPEKGLGLIFGPTASGKTFFTIDLAMSIARGIPWRGRKTTQGRVAYVFAEGGEGGRSRGDAYLQYHGATRKGIPFDALPVAPSLLERGDVKDLITSLKTLDSLKLVVMDTLSQSTPGANENTSEDMGRAIAHCNAIVAHTGAMVILVGHTGKDEGRGHRGWSGMPAALDFIVQLERSGDYRAATVTKLKDGEGEGDEYPFHLQSVTLGTDEDGDAITSCVALPGNKDGAETPTDGLTDNQRLVLQVAGDLLDLGGQVTPKDVREAAKEKLRKPAPGKQDNRARDIKRAYDALITMCRLSDDTGNVRILAG